jgi:hypothetical protein
MVAMNDILLLQIANCNRNCISLFRRRASGTVEGQEQHFLAKHKKSRILTFEIRAQRTKSKKRLQLFNNEV